MKELCKFVCIRIFMKQALIGLSILGLLLSSSVKAEEAIKDSCFKKQYIISVGQPLGLLAKIRISFENRFSPSYAIRLNYSCYYALIPGQHAYLELRKYYKRKYQRLNYVKLGMGHSFESIGSYALIGAGTGQVIPLDKKGKLNLFCTQGIKICPNIIGEHDTQSGGLGGLFYFSGPGAFFDVNFNLAYTF